MQWAQINLFLPSDNLPQVEAVIQKNILPDMASVQCDVSSLAGIMAGLKVTACTGEGHEYICLFDGPFALLVTIV